MVVLGVRSQAKNLAAVFQAFGTKPLFLEIKKPAEFADQRKSVITPAQICVICGNKKVI